MHCQFYNKTARLCALNYMDQLYLFSYTEKKKKGYRRRAKGTETSTKHIFLSEYVTRLKIFKFCDEILPPSLNHGHQSLGIKGSELLSVI